MHQTIPKARRKSSLKLEFSSKEEQSEFHSLGLLKSSKYFIVESSWFESWQSSLSSGESPGVMRTESLLQGSSLKAGLKYPKDYKILNIQQWIFFNAKYGSESPIELKSPFDLKSVSSSVSIPHYLSSPCTTRASLESLSTLKSKPFQLNQVETTETSTFFCNIFGFFAVSPELNKSLIFLNVLLGLQVFQNFLQSSKTSRFLQVLNKLVLKMMNEKFCILKSVSLESLMKVVGMKKDFEWADVLNVVCREGENDQVSQSVKVLVEMKSECFSCGKVDLEMIDVWNVELQIHKNLEIAVKETFDDARIEGNCEYCKEFLCRNRKVVQVRDVICFKLVRKRDIPYTYKVWNKMRYRKIMEILGKIFTLNAVVCEDPRNEEVFTIYVKRGKSWFLFKENNANRVSLAEVLDQIAVVLIYVKLET
jgi:hypothetical protein